MCDSHLQCFLRVCKQLGFPVAEGPTTTLTFLGLELDTVLQQIRLPQAKLAEMLEVLTHWLHHNKTTKRELLSLIGKLAFAARAVPAGRLFLRRLITLSTKVRSLHHRVRLNEEARADICWWNSFLPTWNGTAAFLYPKTTDAHHLELFTDASGTHEWGAYFQGSWFHHSWLPHQSFLKNLHPMAGAFCHTCSSPHMGTQMAEEAHQVQLQAIVLAWQGKSSKQPLIASLLRMLFLTAAQHNFTVTLRHLPGKENEVADALLRRQFTRFFALAPQVDKRPTATPGILNMI